MSCGLDICYCQSNSIIYNILYCFNTSHVTLYQKNHEKKKWKNGVSIHLMLLFIIRTEEIQRLFTIVSIHLILLFILCVLRHIAHFCWFQYISCYSLSLQCTGVGSHIISFQYISCYSLSKTAFQHAVLY